MVHFNFYSCWNQIISSCDLKVHLNTKQNRNVLVLSEIPINMSFYVYMYIIPKETNIIASNSNKKTENDHWLKFENWPLKKYISELSSIIPISIQLLIPDLVFSACKIDRKRYFKKRF